MIDLEEIRSRIDRGVASLTDTYELLFEVERLRKHRESCVDNLNKGYETGMAEERAAVVAYLLRDYDTDDSRDRAAEAIQTGEHRRGEKE